MNRMFVRSLCVVLVAGAAALSGCAGTTDRGVSYTLKADRELEAFIAGDLATVHEAGRRVLDEQYRYRVTNHRADARDGIVEAFTARGDEVRVETTYSSPRVTRVNVFVGPLGDEPVMRELLSAIEVQSRTLAERKAVTSKVQGASASPAASKPGTTQAAPAKPAATQPGATQPGASQPAATKSGTTQPSGTQPGTTPPSTPAAKPATAAPKPTGAAPTPR